MSQPPTGDSGDKPQVNKPESEIHQQPITIDDIDRDLRERIHKIREEFISGLSFVRQHPRSVTFFGSARFEEDHPYYKKAQRIAKRLVDEGMDVVTGGGPGIMEAGNRGASEADRKGASLGLNIELPAEQVLNPYVQKNKEFHYFFSRKVALTFSAEAYIFFPGGFGTMDEFFEILTLVQTEKIVKVPIICVGTDYWGDILGCIETVLLERFETISPGDVKLYCITDDEDEVVELATNAPLRNE